jgi:uncharacterized protein YjiK
MYIYRNGIFLLFVIFLSMAACNNASEKQDNKEEHSGSPESSNAIALNYDLNKPEIKWTLPPDMKEISGITWIDNQHLLAIEDLHPNLYLFKLGDQATIEKVIPFAPERDKKFDIEDVTIADGVVYALWSHGKIFKIANWNSKPQTTEIKTFLTKENNTEGICYDPVSHQLLVACKNESDVEDEKKSTRAIYSFNLKTDQLNEDPFLLIHKKDFKAAEGEKLDFYPSAVAVHPLNHNIYVLSTRGTKCLAEYTHDGKLTGFEFIDPNEMIQPEGLCFAPDGTLYISTEGKHGTPPVLYRFHYTAVKK